MSERRWEYMTLRIGGQPSDEQYLDSGDLKRLDDLGEEGWELASLTRDAERQHIALLKRAVAS